MNTATREVRRGKREIEFTAREYELLKFMARHPCTRKSSLAAALALAAGLLTAGACGASSESENARGGDAGAAEEILAYAPEVANEPAEEYAPEIDPADFVGRVANPYFPLEPSSTFVFEGETEDGVERVEDHVARDTKEILRNLRRPQGQGHHRRGVGRGDPGLVRPGQGQRLVLRGGDEGLRGRRGREDRGLVRDRQGRRAAGDHHGSRPACGRLLPPGVLRGQGGGHGRGPQPERTRLRPDKPGTFGHSSR